MRLRPFFSFFGGKYTLARHYPPPTHDVIVEPFAGGAGYSLCYSNRSVVLVERDPVIAALWRYLIAVSEDEVLALPLDPNARHVLRAGPKALIGFWCGRGRVAPANTTRSAWLRSGAWPSSFWGAYARERIAKQVTFIRHWRIVEGDYTCAPDIVGTWFIDPPYVGSRHYRARVGCYDQLACWARARKGQTIVCEREGASWLPFEHFRNVRSIDRKPKVEVAWVRP